MNDQTRADLTRLRSRSRDAEQTIEKRIEQLRAAALGAIDGTTLRPLGADARPAEVPPLPMRDAVMAPVQRIVAAAPPPAETAPPQSTGLDEAIIRRIERRLETDIERVEGLVRSWGDPHAHAATQAARLQEQVNGIEQTLASQLDQSTYALAARIEQQSTHTSGLINAIARWGVEMEDGIGRSEIAIADTRIALDQVEAVVAETETARVELAAETRAFFDEVREFATVSEAHAKTLRERTDLSATRVEQAHELAEESRTIAKETRLIADQSMKLVAETQEAADATRELVEKTGERITTLESNSAVALDAKQLMEEARDRIAALESNTAAMQRHADEHHTFAAESREVALEARGHAVSARDALDTYASETKDAINTLTTSMGELRTSHETGTRARDRQAVAYIDALNDAVSSISEAMSKLSKRQHQDAQYTRDKLRREIVGARDEVLGQVTEFEVQLSGVEAALSSTLADGHADLVAQMQRDRLQAAEDVEVLVDTIGSSWQALHTSIATVDERVSALGTQLSSIDAQLKHLDGRIARVESLLPQA